MWTRRRVSAIGKAVVVNGELSGDEDLVIEGRVDGDINVPGNAVTVLKHGEVNGNTAARAVDVAGAVRGNITAVERVDLRDTCSVEGNVCAPLVVVARLGAHVRGAIDMRSRQGGKKVA